MTYSTDELYTIVNTSRLKKLGENASTLHQLLLFDNLAGYSPGSDADFFFSQNLIKLGADMILICLTGGINYMSDCIDSINLRPGQFAFHKAGEIIDFIDADMESKVILISLPHDIAIIQNLKDKTIGNFSTVVTPLPEILSEMCTVYKMMKKKLDDENFTLKEEIVYSCLISLLTLLFDSMNRTNNSQKGRNPISDTRQMELYNKFIAAVKANYTRHRDVAFYASEICVSPGHLARIVKTVSGKTVSDWIRDYVILEAKVMLRLQNLPIYQISEALSFPNPSFFSKYFRQKEGLSPSQYRAGLR